MYWSAALSARLVMRTLFRTRTSDVPVLPEGPLILAPNHCSFLDPLLVGGFMDRRVTFMMTAKYYDDPLFGVFYRAARCIVVELEGVNRRALRQAAEVLEAGRTLIVFPEGEISADGQLQELQPGCAWLARRTGVPVYPVHLRGTYEALPRGARRPRVTPLGFRFGSPMRVSDFGSDRDATKAFTAALRVSLLELRAEAEAAR